MKKLIATRAGRVVMAMILGVLFSPSNPASAVNLGIIGLCGLGGFSIAATAIDTRVKALATVVMYDTTRQRRQCSRKPARSWHIITSHKNRWTSTKSLTWSALTTPTRSSAPFNVGRVSRRTVGVAAA